MSCGVHSSAVVCSPVSCTLPCCVPGFPCWHSLCKDHFPFFSMPSLETEPSAERQQNLKWSKVSPSAEVLGCFPVTLMWQEAPCYQHTEMSPVLPPVSSLPHTFAFRPLSRHREYTSVLYAHSCPSVCVFV